MAGCEEEEYEPSSPSARKATSGEVDGAEMVVPRLWIGTWKCHQSVTLEPAPDEVAATSYAKGPVLGSQDDMIDDLCLLDELVEYRRDGRGRIPSWILGAVPCNGGAQAIGPAR